MPSEKDFLSDKVGFWCDKYFAGQRDVPTIDRMRILRLIENLTLGTAAVGYRTESMHGAGSPQAQRIMIARQAQPGAQEGAGQGAGAHRRAGQATAGRGLATRSLPPVTHDGTAMPDPKKLKVVFCGGCNPRIDRAAVAAALRDDETLLAGTSGEVTVHLSGCERACASDHSLLLDGSRVVVVAGECVDGRRAAGHALADTIRRKLKE